MAACKKCKGLGYELKLDLLRARRTKESCRDCKGTGVEQEPVATGARVGVYPGVVNSFQYLESGVIVSELKILVSPVFDRDTGRPLLRDGYVPIIKGEILRLGMQTKYKYRRRGLMTHLLSFARSDPKMRVITCEWDFCTAYGRNFLLSREFKQVDGVLIWENTKR